MNHATVISAGLANHPESNRNCLSIWVRKPWEEGGEHHPITAVWCEPDAPKPLDGDTIQWDHRHVIINGQTWRKVENDSAA